MDCRYYQDENALHREDASRDFTFAHQTPPDTVEPMHGCLKFYASLWLTRVNLMTNSHHPPV